MMNNVEICQNIEDIIIGMVRCQQVRLHVLDRAAEGLVRYAAIYTADHLMIGLIPNSQSLEPEA